MKTGKIGAHVSASGGIEFAIQRAHDIGCTCVQIFSASPRVWKKPSLESYNTKALFEAQARLQIDPIVTHGLYLINLASDNPEQVKKSQDSLIFELKFDSLIHGRGIVVHLGSHQGRGWEASRDQLARTISAILEKTPNDSSFLIENSAGQNGKLCSDLEEIRWLMDQIKSPRLKWCLDTCHAHCAGYLLNPHSKVSQADSKYPAQSLPDVIDQLNLWSTLQCVHVNDSRDPFGSEKDRHENLGDGNIPTEDFHSFLNVQEIRSLPLILEVPGLDGHGPDTENVNRLKAHLA